MNIAIVAAMDEELSPFRSWWQDVAIQRLYERGNAYIDQVGDHLWLVKSGIGKANAAATCAWLCERLSIDVIVNTGTTGSFQSSLPLASIVYSPYCVYADVDATAFGYAYGQVPQQAPTYPSHPALLEHLAHDATSWTSCPVHEGLIVTCDSFMSDSHLIDKIKQHFPDVVATDMESAALAQVASYYQVPVVNIRGISDHVGQHASTQFTATVHQASHNVSHFVIQWVDHLLSLSLL